MAPKQKKQKQILGNDVDATGYPAPGKGGEAGEVGMEPWGKGNRQQGEPDVVNPGQRAWSSSLHTSLQAHLTVPTPVHPFGQALLIPPSPSFPAP